MRDYEEIRNFTDPLSLKKLNDQLRQLWFRAKNVTGKDIRFNTISADQLIVGTNVGLGTAQDETGVTTIVGGMITTDYIKALGLTVGNEITMGENATIRWEQISNPPHIPEEPDLSNYVTSSKLYTTLGQDYVVTGRILANQIYGGTLSVGGIGNQMGIIYFYDNNGSNTGYITNSGLNMKWLYCESLTIRNRVSITSDSANSMALNASTVYCPSLYADNSLSCPGLVTVGSIRFNNTSNSITSASSSISLNTPTVYCTNFYAGGNVSADSFTDRTPFFEGDALSQIKGIRSINGELDHSSLPSFARKTLKVKVKGKSDLSKEIEQDGRDLGAMISILTVGMQQLLSRVEKLESANKAIQA